MAQNINTTVSIVDDFDGTTAAETVKFRHQGKEFEIDLGPLNRANFEKMMTAYEEKMSKYLDAARPTGKAKKTNPEAPKVRAWAQENGYEVGQRGRINKDILDAYRASKAQNKGRKSSKAPAQETLPTTEG